MKPYYESGGITIYHGDCREVLPALPPVGAVIVDPMYDQMATMLEAVSPLTDHPEVCSIVFSQPPFTSIVRARFGERILREIIWYYPKLHKWSSDNLPLAAHYVLSWVPATPRYFQRRAGESYSAETQEGEKGYLVFRGYKEKLAPFTKDSAGRCLSDVIVMDRVIHSSVPHQKPIELLCILLRGLCDPSIVVLDPFMGSGTTLRAAKDLGRKAIGIEVEERYCEIAARRLDQEVLGL